jgi:signal peptidase I
MNTTTRETLAFVRDITIVILLVVLIRTYVFAPFAISGHSMESSFHDGEFILVNKWNYAHIAPTASLDWRVGDPKRWDVVVLKPHVSVERQYYIKRVIGLPGDTIRIASGAVYLTLAGTSREIMLDEEAYLNDTNNGNTKLPGNLSTDTFTVPEGSYWVMGDNRNNSSDSRQCFSMCVPGGSTHFVTRSNIVGKPLFSFGGIHIEMLPYLDGAIRLPTPVNNLEFRGTKIPKEYSYPEIGA